MANDILRFDSIALGQHPHKFSSGGHLPRRGRIGLEIADQADADALFVVAALPGMCPVQLLLPAEGGLDQSVGHASAVADQEVVSDAQPGVAGAVLPASMLRIDRGHVARVCGRMMQHDVAPASRR